MPESSPRHRPPKELVFPVRVSPKRFISANTDEGELWKGKVSPSDWAEIDCALKLVNLSRSEPVWLKVVRNEVQLLSLLRHTNLLKILFYGIDSTSAWFADRAQFAIVTEWIEGKDMSESWGDGRTFVRHLSEVLEALAFMHEHGVMHMDIKPTNIRIQASPSTESPDQAVLIDLGFSIIVRWDLFKTLFGQRVKKSRGTNTLTVSPDDIVYVAFTKPYAGPDSIKYHHRWVKRSIVEGLFPQHDLWSLGKVIREGLDNVSFGQKEGWLREGLTIIASKLEGGEYIRKDSPQTAMGSVLHDMQNLKMGLFAPFGVPELSTIVESGNYIQLSTNSISLTPELIQIVNHPFLQRLRHIPQLEFLYLVYSDAHHSRFSHSLTTFNFARLALRNLLVDPTFRLQVDQDDIRGTILFALLHDIGHYPLSHMFEDFSNEDGRSSPVLSDEALFVPFVNLDSRDLGWIHNKLGNRKSLADEIRSAFGSRTLTAMLKIAAIAYHNKRAGYPRTEKKIHAVLAGLVSSAIDVDKISYLTLDSRMTGVPYGSGLDLQGYLSSLKTPHRALEKGTSKEPIIGIAEKGLAAVESTILARYWMLSRVYWHHTNRSVMAAYKFVIRKLLDSDPRFFDTYLKRTFWMTETEATEFLWRAFQRLPNRKHLYDPIGGLMRRERDLYKRLVTIARIEGNSQLYDKIMLDFSKTDYRSVEKKLMEIGAKFVEAATDGNRQGIEEFFVDGKLKEGAVLVDIPRKRRDQLHLERIYVVGEEGGIKKATEKSITTSSPLLASLGRREKNEFLVRVKKIRLFLHPKLAAYIGDLADRREEVRDMIRNSFNKPATR